MKAETVVVVELWCSFNFLADSDGVPHMRLLKTVREDRGLSQVQAAKILGVSRHVYQSMEAGSATVPFDAEAKLMLFPVVDDPHPVEVRQVSSFGAGRDDFNHHGDVVVNFVSGNEKLIFRVSFFQMNVLKTGVANGRRFLVFRTLANQIIILNSAVVADIVFIRTDLSGFIRVDDSGRENPVSCPIMEPDLKVWLTAECLYYDDRTLYEFEKGEFSEYYRYLNEKYINDEYSALLMKCAGQSDAEILTFLEQRRVVKEMFADLLTRVRYRLVNGAERQFDVRLIQNLKFAFHSLVTDEDCDVTNIWFDYDRGGMFVTIPSAGFEFISLPNHRFETSKFIEN